MKPVLRDAVTVVVDSPHQDIVVGMVDLSLIPGKSNYCHVERASDSIRSK